MQTLMDNGVPQFDRAGFAVNPHARRIEKPWGWEMHWTPVGLPYVGKVIHINAGARLSLQVHDAKSESWLLVAGRCLAVWENTEGELIETELEAGVGYTCAVGQRHRLIGITDCEVIEVSTPEVGTTWRLEDDYARPHETPAQRERERA